MEIDPLSRISVTEAIHTVSVSSSKLDKDWADGIFQDGPESSGSTSHVGPWNQNQPEPSKSNLAGHPRVNRSAGLSLDDVKYNSPNLTVSSCP